MRFFTLMLLVLSFGCADGAVELQVNDTTQPDLSTELATSEGSAKELKPAFEIPRDYAQLLPFHVRMNKLQAVTGAPLEDPMFTDVLRNRYGLGDHNYGQGIGADLTWSAAKMSTWVKSMRPICASEAMRTRYPALPEDVNELAIAAYGREVDQADLETLDEAVNGVIDADQRYEAVCLAVLSSMEFVGR